MSIVNKNVTLLGSTAKVTCINIFPQDDGTYRVEVHGTVSDGGNVVDSIRAAGVFPASAAALSNMTATALQRLRQANGLET